MREGTETPKSIRGNHCVNNHHGNPLEDVAQKSIAHAIRQFEVWYAIRQFDGSIALTQ